MLTKTRREYIEFREDNNLHQDLSDEETNDVFNEQEAKNEKNRTAPHPPSFKRRNR